MPLDKMAPAKEGDSRDLFRFQFKKTRLCSFYVEGRCRAGNDCAFAHDMAQMETPPDLTKTSLCAKWEKGQCTHTAATCKFAHGKHELRMTPQFARGRGEKKPNEKKIQNRTRQVVEKATTLAEGLDLKTKDPFARLEPDHLSRDLVDHSFGISGDRFGAAVFAPPPGLPNVEASYTWMNEPMKIKVNPPFDNEAEFHLADNSAIFQRKITHDWESGTTTAGSNSDERSPRSQSPSSFRSSTHTDHTLFAMMGSPWNFTKASF
jgi:hypothetical protein